jgi:hypothetical protein
MEAGYEGRVAQVGRMGRVKGGLVVGQHGFGESHRALSDRVGCAGNNLVEGWSVDKSWLRLYV